MSFDFEEKRLKQEIANRNSKRVLLQLPEGLKPEAPRLVAVVEAAGALPIVSADPCYGACDLAVSEAKLLGADLIVHYGHSAMISDVDVPTIYIEVKVEISVKEAVLNSLELLESFNKVGLVTTIQHVHQLDEAKTLLEQAGKTVFVGDAGHVKYGGQVLGCDFSNATSVSDDVDAFVFVGGGRFHAIGLALATGKPTIVTDPYEQLAYPVHDQVRRVMMQRWANISEAKTAKSFGVLVSLKTGQMKLKEAIGIKQKLVEHGYTVTLLAIKEVSPNALIQFPTIDAFVNTACPRLSLDDAPNYDKPILSINETLVVLGELKWETLLQNGWFANAT